MDLEKNTFFTKIGITSDKKCLHSTESINFALTRIRPQTRNAKCNLCFSNRLRQTLQNKSKVKRFRMLAIRSSRLPANTNCKHLNV